ncbi:MAG: transcriptional repressor [Clostridia bacterium]|nr:transcriptional repressor [Clostridia bacterium]
MSYTTKPRTLLHAYLKNHAHAHISMHEILDFARKEGIGTATVYRYLDKLLKEGFIIKYAHGGTEGGACFQWHEKDCTLYHFVCNDCGKCFHLDCSHLDSVDAHIQAHHAFSVDLSQTVFRGRCKACMGKENA